MSSASNAHGGTVIPLSGDRRLSALVCPYRVDGRVTWHPADARGWAGANCYLLVEDDAALLVDTGLAAHRDAVLAMLDAALPGELPLSILTLRQGEFDSVGNVVPICARRPVSFILGAYPEGQRWADFHADVRWEPIGTGPVPEALSVPRHAWLEIAPGRRIELIRPALRLLNTWWGYDEATGTAFTSDSFVHGVRPSPQGPWLMTGPDDDTTERIVRDHLRANRFWWLPGADVRAIRADVAAFFAEREVTTIAPALGAIIHGREAVRRHVALLESVLADVDGRSVPA